MNEDVGVEVAFGGSLVLIVASEHQGTSTLTPLAGRQVLGDSRVSVVSLDCESDSRVSVVSLGKESDSRVSLVSLYTRE